MSGIFVNTPEVFLDTPSISTNEIAVPVIFDGFDSKAINSFTLSIDVDPSVCRALRIENKTFKSGEFTWFQNELSKKLVLVWYDVKDGFVLQSGKLLDIVFATPTQQPLPLRFVQACEVTHSIFAVPGIIYTGITIGNESQSLFTYEEVEESKLVYDSTLDTLAKYQPGLPANDVIDNPNPVIVFEKDEASNTIKGIAIQIPEREEEIKSITTTLETITSEIYQKQSEIEKAAAYQTQAQATHAQLELQKLNAANEVERAILIQQQAEAERLRIENLKKSLQLQTQQQILEAQQLAAKQNYLEAQQAYELELAEKTKQLQAEMQKQAETALQLQTAQDQLTIERLLKEKAQQAINETQQQPAKQEAKTEIVQLSTAKPDNSKRNIMFFVAIVILILILKK